MPVDDKPYDPYFYPHAPKAMPADARVIGYTDALNGVGSRQVVSISAGTADGVDNGTTFMVMSQGDRIPDETAGNYNRRDTSPKVQLPDEYGGHVMVFRTFDHVSYALVWMPCARSRRATSSSSPSKKRTAAHNQRPRTCAAVAASTVGTFAPYTGRMIDSDDLREWMILLRTPGLSARRLREGLLARGGAGGLLAWLSRHPDTLTANGRAWIAAPDEATLTGDLAWLAGDDQRLLKCTDEDFPPQLEAIPDPPAALFVKGDPGLLLRPQIGIVGARRAQPPGLANARRFASELATGGLLVTSGMADGIDGAAHEAALDAGEPTIAVIGTGPDRVYPRKHHALAQRIASQGAIVSEFPPGAASQPAHFPQRNRIIAGLRLGVLVVEAGLRSGSLITARQAGEQGREVFALPGSIHNPLAERLSRSHRRRGAADRTRRRDPCRAGPGSAGSRARSCAPAWSARRPSPAVGRRRRACSTGARIRNIAACSTPWVTIPLRWTTLVARPAYRRLRCPPCC